MYYYLESPEGHKNPYGDTYSRQNPGKAPLIRHLSDAEMKRENVDTPEEKEWGMQMSS
jgi:Ino eighty subunit 1